MEMTSGNMAGVTDVIDLSTLYLFKKDKVLVYGLMDGSRVIAEETASDTEAITVKHPFRILLRPVDMNRVSVEMTDFVVGGDKSDTSISIRQTAIIFSHKPDNQILNSYADHLSRYHK